MFIQSEQGTPYLSYCLHRYNPLGSQVVNTLLCGKLSVNSSCLEQLSISKGGVGSFVLLIFRPLIHLQSARHRATAPWAVSHGSRTQGHAPWAASHGSKTQGHAPWAASHGEKQGHVPWAARHRVTHPRQQVVVARHRATCPGQQVMAARHRVTRLGQQVMAARHRATRPGQQDTGSRALGSKSW